MRLSRNFIMQDHDLVANKCCKVSHVILEIVAFEIRGTIDSVQEAKISRSINLSYRTQIV